MTSTKLLDKDNAVGGKAEVLRIISEIIGDTYKIIEPIDLSEKSELLKDIKPWHHRKLLQSQSFLAHLFDICIVAFFVALAFLVIRGLNGLMGYYLPEFIDSPIIAGVALLIAVSSFLYDSYIKDSIERYIYKIPMWSVCVPVEAIDSYEMDPKLATSLYELCKSVKIGTVDFEIYFQPLYINFEVELKSGERFEVFAKKIV